MVQNELQRKLKCIKRRYRAFKSKRLHRLLCSRWSTSSKFIRIWKKKIGEDPEITNLTITPVAEQKAPEQTIIKHNVNAGKEIQNVVDNSPQTKADYSVDNNPKQNLDGLNQNNHVNLDNNPSDDLGK